MKAVIQRVTEASVSIDGKVVGEIESGFTILLGVTHGDGLADIDALINKIIHLRVFEDDAGKMNLSLQDVGGSILSISQFTLYGDIRKGRRPSFTKAANPAEAKDLYEQFNTQLTTAGIHVETGEFGAEMAVSLINDGPVTIIAETENGKII